MLDKDGELVAERVRVPTTYPMPPDTLVVTLTQLGAKLPPGRPHLRRLPGHGAQRSRPRARRTS